MPAAVLGVLGWLLASWARGQERRVSALERRLDDQQQAADEAFERLAAKMAALGEALTEARERVTEVATIAKMLRDRNGRR